MDNHFTRGLSEKYDWIGVLCVAEGHVAIHLVPVGGHLKLRLRRHAFCRDDQPRECGDSSMLRSVSGGSGGGFVVVLATPPTLNLGFLLTDYRGSRPIAGRLRARCGYCPCRRPCLPQSALDGYRTVGMEVPERRDIAWSIGGDAVDDDPVLTAFVVDETFVGDFAVNVDEAAVELAVSEIVFGRRHELFIDRLLGFQRAIHSGRGRRRGSRCGWRTR